MKAPLVALLMLFGLSGCAGKTTVYTYQHRWSQTEKPSGVQERLRTITRVYLYASQARLENDFEIWLIDFKQDELWWGNPEARTYERLPLSKTIACPPQPELWQQYGCEPLLSHNDGTLQIACKNKDSSHQIKGRRQALPPQLISTLHSAELLPHSAACMLQAKHLEIQTLSVKQSSTTADETLDLHLESIHHEKLNPQRFQHNSSWKITDHP